jgi:hypothetical protein
VRRLRQALRAGLSTLLLGVLCTATLAAPGLAGVDFAHTHPEATATCADAHLHPFKLIFGQGEGAPPAATLEFPPQAEHTAPLAAPAPVSAEVPAPYQSRAPPRLA